jgi:hypothetical protein
VFKRAAFDTSLGELRLLTGVHRQDSARRIWRMSS